MDTQTPWYIIVNTIQFNHRSGENATRILHALKEAGYTIERPVLPETMSVYSPDPRNTSMFAGAKPPGTITTEDVRRRYRATMIRETGVDPLGP